MTCDFEELLRAAKKRLLTMHYRAKSGHLGGNLSCIDALMVLHHLVMRPEDRFLLSKGHAAGALYVTLWSLGKLGDQCLEEFCQDDSPLPGHPCGQGIPDLLFSTGSLGHGPSLAAGLALAARHRQSDRRVFCLCSDGEWQEGSCWEALIFSVHHRLANLTFIIDQNGLQGFGKTTEIISCGDLTDRISAFGPDVRHVDGHNYCALREAFVTPSPERPTVVIMDTIKGNGLDSAGRVESHYLPLSAEEYDRVCGLIDAGRKS
jgi:transketolase